MFTNELETSRIELLSIRESMTGRPAAGPQDLERRLEKVCDSIKRVGWLKTKMERDLLVEVNRLIGDIAALCTQAGNFYDFWSATLGSLAGEYDSRGIPAVTPERPALHSARG